MIRLKKCKAHYSTSSSKKFRTSALLRITKDIQDLNLPQTCELNFPDPNDLYHFQVTIRPDEGFYKDIETVFEFNIRDTYPYEPPKVKCIKEIYHPNIDTDGNVCLNILREEWNPVLSINSIIYGLQYLLLEPNPFDALNEKAANDLQYNRTKFEVMVNMVASDLLSAESASEDVDDDSRLFPV